MPLQLLQEAVDLTLYVIFQTFLADLNVVLLIEPFNDSVLYLTDSLKVCEILLKLISIRSHVFDSVVVAYVFLIRQGLEHNRSPLD